MMKYPRKERGHYAMKAMEYQQVNSWVIKQQKQKASQERGFGTQIIVDAQLNQPARRSPLCSLGLL
ncbi:hypothetical protein KKIDH5335_20410 [Vibrio fluvialis]|nr:hypothetical protein KKIDH5335_20410 [Vibrio fluvialis]